MNRQVRHSPTATTLRSTSLPGRLPLSSIKTQARSSQKLVHSNAICLDNLNLHGCPGISSGRHTKIASSKTDIGLRESFKTSA
jgi:hypothetical protein